jgi:hypothetical protein
VVSKYTCNLILACVGRLSDNCLLRVQTAHHSTIAVTEGALMTYSVYLCMWSGLKDMRLFHFSFVCWVCPAPRFVCSAACGYT